MYKEKIMLLETLQALYDAVRYNDEKTTKELLNGLHRMGVDNISIKIMIEGLIKEGLIA